MSKQLKSGNPYSDGKYIAYHLVLEWIKRKAPLDESEEAICEYIETRIKHLEELYEK